MSTHNEHDQRTNLAAGLPTSREGTPHRLFTDAAKDTSPTSGLPGFETSMLRSMMGNVAWGRLRLTDDVTRMGTGDISTGSTANRFAEVQVTEGPHSGRLDDQRLLVRRSQHGKGVRGEDVVDRIMIGVKRSVDDFATRGNAGSLDELILKDGITTPVLGLALEYENPSLNSESPNNKGVSLARLRFVTPPQDADVVQAEIAAANAARGDDRAATVVGAWHSFDYWQPGDTRRNAYAVQYEDYAFNSEAEGFKPGAILDIPGDHARIHAEVLTDRRSSNGDPLIAINIGPVDWDPTQGEPLMSFTVPATMTFSR